MIRRTLCLAFGSILASLTAPVPAFADEWSWGGFTDQCGVLLGGPPAGTFKLCMSVSVGIRDRSDGGTSLVIRIQNLNGVPGTAGADQPSALIYRLATQMHGTIPSGEYSGAASVVGKNGATGSGAGSYFIDTSWGPNVSQFDLGVGIQGCGGPSSTAWSTCGLGAFVELAIDFDFHLTIDELWFSEVEAVRDNCSEVPCDVPNSDGTTGWEFWSFGSVVPVSAVPEPVTMILLGTGLAGLGAVRARRRKKDQQV